MSNYEVIVYGLEPNEEKALKLAIAKADEAKKLVDVLKEDTDAYKEARIVYGMYLAAVKYFVGRSK